MFGDPHLFRRWPYRTFATFFPALAIAAFLSLRPSIASAATCSVATGSAAHALCWLDLSSFTPTPLVPQTITFTLPDGSTLTATFENLSATYTPSIVAVPTYSGAALGNTAYTGIAGKPAVYASAATSPVNVSGVSVTDPAGRTLPSVTIVAADAESLDTGDGTPATANLTWTTTGTAWSLFQIMNSTGGGATPICTLSGLGTLVATCVPSSSGNNAAYILQSTVTPLLQAITMSATTKAKQGYAFAVDLASLAVKKTVVGREASGDQFTVAISRGAVTAASATTAGTATTAASGSIAVFPTDTYTMSEAASGTASLANYVSSYACANATAGSSTTLPAGTGTTFTLTPAGDDQITCTFTNDALLLTVTANTPARSFTPGTVATDLFTLKNTSGVPGTFVIAQPTLVPSAGLAPVASGYTYGGTTYATLLQLQAAVTAAGPTAAGASIAIGVVYAYPASAPATVSVTLTGAIASGTSASTQQSAVESDAQATANLTIVKSGTTAASPGGLIAYAILVSNAGPQAANGAIVSDPLPMGLAYESSSCSAAGGAVCATPVVTTSGGITTVTTTLTTLPVNATATIAIFTTAGAGSAYTNVATVTPPTGYAGGSQQSTLVTSVAQSNGITKTVTNLTNPQFNAGAYNTTTQNGGVPGDRLRYALSFTNTTGQPLGSFAFNDTIPANTTYVSASCPTTFPANLTGCTASVSGGGLTFSFSGTLAPGATITATFVVTID